MFSLSLCMIVKDESDVLERSLACAKQFADEIVVVDTGSKDNTVEIAKKFTKKVFSFKWCDDFSKARNFSFSKATCDYVMWLDADDVLTPENIEKINSLKKGEFKTAQNEFAANDKLDVDVYMCSYSMGFDDENRPSLTYFRERILRRKSDFKWEGFVHEAIVPRGKIAYTDIDIEHRKVHETAPMRNLKLYRKAKQRKVKFSAREQYYYSRELFYNNYFSSAITNFKKFLKMPAYPPDNLMGHILLAKCYKEKGQFDKALSTLLSALQKHQPTGELCCEIAYIFEKQKLTEQAIFWFKSALCTKMPTQGFVHVEYQDFVPCVELSRLLYSQNYSDAKYYHEQAKRMHPQNPVILQNEKYFQK